MGIRDFGLGLGLRLRVQGLLLRVQGFGAYGLEGFEFGEVVYFDFLDVVSCCSISKCLARQ